MAAQTLAEQTELARVYQNAELEDVSVFLAKFAFLQPLLRHIAKQTGIHFPKGTLSLSISRDPSGLDKDQLAVNIHTPLSPLEALDKLREFDHWWLENENRA